jgi:hypothetical protein
MFVSFVILKQENEFDSVSAESAKYSANTVVNA